MTAFRSRPWSWSPWWGGWRRQGGFGLSVGSWGWSDWWGPWGYAPLAYQTGYWNYYNPYCEQPLVLGTTVIDYSQPIVLLDDAAKADPDASADPAVSTAMAYFDAARNAFSRGDYKTTQQFAQRSLEHLPSDAALHEFMALVHFAQGNYRDAATTIHSVLAVGPGWSWDTLRNIYGYGNVDAYTKHLRAAEAYRGNHPKSADVRFLLAYHYLTTGSRDAAADQLRRVLTLEPNDTVAAQLLKGLTGESGESAATEPSKSSVEPGVGPVAAPVPVGVPTVTVPPAGSLVGSWEANRGDGSQFALTLSSEGRFTWAFTQGDRKTELAGKYSLKDDLLVLEPEHGGAMIGRLTVTGDAGKAFRFRLVGTPEDDPGLTFQK